MRLLPEAIDKIFCNLIDHSLGETPNKLSLLNFDTRPGSNMATEDRASRQRYIAEAISICGPIAKQGIGMERNGTFDLKWLQSDAMAFLYTHTPLFFRPPFDALDPGLRELVLTHAFPRLSSNFSLLSSGPIIDTPKALENVELELSTVRMEQWTASVLGSVLSSTARRLVWQRTQGEAFEDTEAAVYDLLRGAVYGCAGSSWGDNHGNGVASMTMTRTLLSRRPWLCLGSRRRWRGCEQPRRQLGSKASPNGGELLVPSRVRAATSSHT